MSLLRLPLLLIVFVLATGGAIAQQSAPAQQPIAQPSQRDAKALAVLQASTAAMGKSLPADSTAQGTVTTTAGSLSESGTVTVLTKGTTQTSEQIQTPHGFALVYSDGQASHVADSATATLSSELALSSRSFAFPLVALADVLNNPDSGYAYVGLESVDGAALHHLQFWNSFNSRPKFQPLASLTLTDLWIDSATGLPQRISQIRRAGRGSEPRIQVDVSFSDYRNVSGVLYPFQIQESINGSPWKTLTITSVTFNTGLTDTNFPIQ